MELAGRNGEGYPDPTAGTEIRNIEKEERRSQPNIGF